MRSRLAVCHEMIPVLRHEILVLLEIADVVVNPFTFTSKYNLHGLIGFERRPTTLRDNCPVSVRKRHEHCHVEVERFGEINTIVSHIVRPSPKILSVGRVPIVHIVQFLLRQYSVCYGQNLFTRPIGFQKFLYDYFDPSIAAPVTTKIEIKESCIRNREPFE